MTKPKETKASKTNTGETKSSGTKASEAKASVTKANKSGATVTEQSAPLKLDLFDGDTVGFCDAETGICALPEPADVAGAAGQQGKSGVTS